MPLTSQLLFNKEDPNLIRWGLYKVVRALEFINQDCGMVHANVCPESIFVTKAGEWKLAGFELLDSFNESQPKFMIYTGAIRNYAPRMSPEFRGQQWSRLKGLDRGVTDGWQLGVLIHSIYNEGDVTRQSGQFNSQGAVPGELWLLCKRLLSPSPEDRLAPATFMQVASRQGGYFDNPFVHSNSFLENMAVKSDEEKQQFLTQLERDIDKYPETFAKFRILPELLKVMEFAGGDSKVFSVVIKIGNMMDRDEYEQTIMPSIISLFKSDNRRLRFDLLTNLSTFIHQLPRRQVSRDIFPNFVKGFFDMEPAIRDATVKASIHISPQLEDKELYELVKGLVRLQTDRESSIRTNVLICLSKLVERQDMRITKSMYQDVLAPALLNSTRDPYPPARNASLVALLKCAPHLDAKLVARRVLPSLIPAMIDTEKNVRVSASKVVSMFVKQLEAHATKMPDTTTLARKPGTAGIGQPKEMGDSRGQAKSGALGADGWGDWA
ncbi:Nuclear aminoacylation-dependent tRNA export pathway component, partial [Spiromyces aspiralis]